MFNLLWSHDSSIVLFFQSRTPALVFEHINNTDFKVRLEIYFFKFCSRMFNVCQMSYSNANSYMIPIFLIAFMFVFLSRFESCHMKKKELIYCKGHTIMFGCKCSSYQLPSLCKFLIKVIQFFVFYVIKKRFQISTNTHSQTGKKVLFQYLMEVFNCRILTT